MTIAGSVLIRIVPRAMGIVDVVVAVVHVVVDVTVVICRRGPSS